MGLLDQLNEVQAAAVQHKDGPLLILSGAGSGKTRVITHRIAYMLTEHKISPDNILAVTFTRKAAQEMKQRLIQLIGDRSRKLQISTIHSACYHILQENIHHHERLNLDNVVDFDDLIKYTIEMFQEDSRVLKKYQDKFRYIMVDEYQDTDKSQYCLINMLARKYRNLCVVGDDDQSIYAFRGADITNLLSFEDDYPDALVLKLEQNYRSTQTIVKAANSIIQNNVKRKAKYSWTKNDRGEPIITYGAGDTYGEASYVLRHIQGYVASGYSYSDCAVLYRINSQAWVFEELFQESNIPYKIVGDSGFYEQADAVSMMTLHSSKGLEFPIVFLVGVQEGLMPHRETSGSAAVEEERRLCYVGITRAEKILHISWATTRVEQQAVKSRFVDEIPGDWRTQQQQIPQVRPQQTPPVRQKQKSWQESMQEWRNEKQQALPVRQAWQDHQRPQEPRTQQKPEGGMCGVIVLACGIVGIFVLLTFIF